MVEKCDANDPESAAADLSIDIGFDKGTGTLPSGIAEADSRCDLTEYSGRRVVVLGGSGFIGRWVAKKLFENDAEMFLVVRNRRVGQEIFRTWGVCGEVVEMDVTDRGSSIEEWFRTIRPSITFNLVGYGVDPSERDSGVLTRINSSLVNDLCRTALGVQDPTWIGQDLVHTGSALEYGDIEGDLAEESEARPTTEYGVSKLAGTRHLSEWVASHGLKGLTARLFTVYGPGEHPGRLLPCLIRSAASRTPLDMTAGAQSRDFTYVEDVAEGLLRLGLVSGACKSVVNLATGRLTPVRSFAEQVASLLSVPAENLRFGAIPTRREEMVHSPVCVAELNTLIQWTPPTSVSQGIEKTLRFWSQSAVRH